MQSGDEIQLVLFRVGPQEMGLEIGSVERILRYEPPTPLPDAPDFLEGVATVGAGVVPVVDLRRRLGVPAVQGSETRLMIVEVGDQRVGLVVDEAREVRRVDGGAVSPPPPLVRGLAAAYILGLVTLESRTIVLLNTARILNATEQLALADLAA